MKPVVIIANPASGKDIRRLVAHGLVVPNSEKVNIIRRVLTGLDSAGVERVLFMPDNYGLGQRALDGLTLSLETGFLGIDLDYTQDDSTRAARMATEIGAACIIVLGGDGTNRVVAKTCGETPLLPIATGTNNVFSSMIEGTLAGIAAGVFTMNGGRNDELSTRQPRLEIWHNGELKDIALVDAVVSGENFVASRALWEAASLKQVFLTRAEPENIGFSSLGGYLHRLPPGSGLGLHLRIGPGRTRIKAPIAPGLVKWVPIESFRTFGPGEEIIIDESPSVVALDGEREFTVARGQALTLKLNLDGPWVINLSAALQHASRMGFFVEEDDRVDQ